ncbi:MAG: hypothetical protein V3T77_08180, partial [Planctomycetota bacterium]
IPLALWAMWVGREPLWRWRRVTALVSLFFLGLAPYLYLPLAAAQPALSSWGDPTTWQGFSDHLLRREFGTLRLGPNPEGAQLIPGLAGFLGESFRQLLWIGPPLAVWGLLLKIRREGARGLGVVSLVAFLLYLGVFHSLANLPLQDPFYREIQSRFWPQALLLLCAWAGLGMARVRWRQGVVPVCIALQIGLHFGQEDQSDRHLFEHFGRSTLSSLPLNAVLLSVGDLYYNTVHYLQEVEGVRRDVRLLDRELLQAPWMNERIRRYYPDLQIPGRRYLRRKGGGGKTSQDQYNLVELLDANRDAFEFYVTPVPEDDPDTSWVGSYEAWPVGFVSVLRPRGQHFDVKQHVAKARQVVDAFLPLLEELKGTPRPGSWEEVVWKLHWETDNRLARRLLESARARNHDPTLLRSAANTLERLLATHPQPRAQLWKNLGIIYSQLARTDPEAISRVVHCWQKFLEKVPAGDPEAAQIRQALWKIQTP